MTEREERAYAAVTRRVKRVRRIYSGIGEPLPVKTIILLTRTLGKTLRWTAYYRKSKGHRH